MSLSDADSLTGHLLVIDDQAYFRAKISHSLVALGYKVKTVSSGAAALEEIQSSVVDVILLDMMMPDMDGFEVLKRLKENDRSIHVPVIVISALEDHTESVVEAIKLGAEDFLPKNYALPLLRARVNASLQKKRNRDRELDKLDALQQLMNVTGLLEQGTYNPSKLGLDSISSREDALGTLACVFGKMAQKVYDRERRLRRQSTTLKGLFLLFLCGLLFGLDAPIAKIMSQFGEHPLGTSIWINVIACLLTLPYSIYKKDIPAFSWPLFWYFLIWGFCSCVLGDVLLLIAAEHLQASALSIILVLEVLLVFAYSAITKLEKATHKRFCGLLIGLAGVALAVYTQENSGNNLWVWALVALGVPVGYAAIDILIVISKQVDMHPATTLGIASLFGVIIMIPIAWHQEGFVSVSLLPGSFEFGLILWGVLAVAGMLTLVKLIDSAGVVFGSQTAYVMTFAGIFWSMVLIGEVLTSGTWVALGIICIGLLLVEPKHEAEEEVPERLLENLKQNKSNVFD